MGGPGSGLRTALPAPVRGHVCSQTNAVMCSFIRLSFKSKDRAASMAGKVVLAMQQFRGDTAEGLMSIPWESAQPSPRGPMS